MKLNTLRNTSPRKNRKRVGRGDGNNWGRTCGRGEKGQKSRSGYSRKSYFEGGQIPLFRRLPKRGFNHPANVEYTLVNVKNLEQNFDDGEHVTIDVLISKGMVGKKVSDVKILGDGDISKALTVEATQFSASAKAKIEAAKGTCKLV